MSGFRAPEVATPRVMAQTVAVLYAFGGATALLAALGAESQGVGRWLIVGLASTALTGACVLAHWGPRWPRAAFHAPVGAGSALVASAVLASPDGATALACAAISSFIAVDAYFFFRGLLALAHLATVVLGTTAALLVQGDVALPTALAGDVVVIALGTVTRQLVVRASNASRDPLTGLRNRRGFDDAMNELIGALPRTGQRLSAALLDLDHFKAINDSEGHEAGDRVLRQFADVWRGALPAAAVLARHGGDEFALLLPGVAGPAALELVRRLCTMHPGIGLSCGVAEYRAAESAAQLMRRADLALYSAKVAGRGRCELDGGAASDLARDLAVAIAAGEVRVHFQPILDLRDDTVVGVEALARWTHPERGPVSPVEFVAVAEQHGMIDALGEQVMRTACTQLVMLHALTGRRLRLGVNVSGRELPDSSYPHRVGAVLAETGWPAADTMLEVTESSLDADSPAAVATLHALRAMGVKIAIDDFGTGYSSLSRLDTLPADILKLDASFVATITTSPRRAEMLRSIVGLARALGMDVVAEGVETADQDALVRAVGCSSGQGWRYGRPMVLADLIALLVPQPHELAATGT